MALAAALASGGCAAAPAPDPFADLQPDLARSIAERPSYCLETFYRGAMPDGRVRFPASMMQPSDTVVLHRQRDYASYPVTGSGLIREAAALEAAGLITPDDPPEQGGMRYWRLTDEARKHRGEYAGDLCWGRWTLVSVKITRQPRKIRCFRVNDVEAVVRFDGVPPWAQTEGFRSAFPRAPTVDGKVETWNLTMTRMTYPDNTVRWARMDFGPHSDAICA